MTISVSLIPFCFIIYPSNILACKKLQASGVSADAYQPTIRKPLSTNLLVVTSILLYCVASVQIAYPLQFYFRHELFFQNSINALLIWGHSISHFLRNYNTSKINFSEWRHCIMCHKLSHFPFTNNLSLKVVKWFRLYLSIACGGCNALQGEQIMNGNEIFLFRYCLNSSKSPGNDFSWNFWQDMISD